MRITNQLGLVTSFQKGLVNTTGQNENNSVIDFFPIWTKEISKKILERQDIKRNKTIRLKVLPTEK